MEIKQAKDLVEGDMFRSPNSTGGGAETLREVVSAVVGERIVGVEAKYEVTVTGAAFARVNVEYFAFPLDMEIFVPVPVTDRVNHPDERMTAPPAEPGHLPTQFPQ